MMVFVYLRYLLIYHFSFCMHPSCCVIFFNCQRGLSLLFNLFWIQHSLNMFDVKVTTARSDSGTSTARHASRRSPHTARSLTSQFMMSPSILRSHSSPALVRMHSPRFSYDCHRQPASCRGRVALRHLTQLDALRTLRRRPRQRVDSLNCVRLAIATSRDTFSFQNFV